jgi:hypothetical protein
MGSNSSFKVLIFDSIDGCTSSYLITSSYAVDYDAQFYLMDGYDLSMTTLNCKNKHLFLVSLMCFFNFNTFKTLIWNKKKDGTEYDIKYILVFNKDSSARDAQILDVRSSGY